MEDNYTILQDLGNGRKKIQYESQGKVITTILGANEALYKGDRVPKSYLLRIKETQEKNKQTVDIRPFQEAMKQLDYHYNLVMDKRKVIEQTPSYMLQRAIAGERYHRQELEKHDDIYNERRQKAKEEYERILEKAKRDYETILEKIDREDEKKRENKERMYQTAQDTLHQQEKTKPEELIKKEEAYKRAYQKVLETQRGLNINQEGKIDDKYILNIVRDIELPNTTYITIPVYQPPTSSYTAPMTSWIPPITSEELELQRMREEAVQEEKQREREEAEQRREAREKALAQRKVDEELELQRLQQQRKQELETREPPPIVSIKPIIKKKLKREEHLERNAHLYAPPV